MNFYLASLKNMKDEKPKAIRLNIVLRSTDIGFEFIYQELSKLNDQASRSKFIKMFLHDACVGVPLKASTQKITNLDKRGSFSFGLRLSPNEIGFEKLYKELIAFETTFERNQHVRRFIFKSISNSQSADMNKSSPHATESQSLSAPVENGTTSLLTPLAEQADEPPNAITQLMARKKAVLSLGF